MWIHHIGEIMIAVFVLLIAAHFGLHLYFKNVKRKKNAQKAAQRNTNEPPSQKD